MKDKKHIYKAVDIALRIGFLGILIIWCFNILRPLIGIVAWGAIIAIGIYPLYLKLTDLTKGREKLSAILISIVGISLLLLPLAAFVNITIGNVNELVGVLEISDIDISIPYENFENIPFGDRLYEIYENAADNIEETLTLFVVQLKSLAPKLLSLAAGAGATILQFVISIGIAGMFLVSADKVKVGADKVFSILVGEYVDEFPVMAAASIRSVVQGVLGIAVIQSFFGFLGMYIMNVPGAGILSILLLIVCIVQLPPIMILLPVAGYVFTVVSTIPAILYLVWSILVGLIDNVLKPMLLGKGVDVPMLVILLGAIGGMIGYGIIGLFVGPVVLVLGYKVLEAVIENNHRKKTEVKVVEERN